MKALMVAAFVAAVTSSCTGKDERPVPKPEAYPRIALYDTAYTVVKNLPVVFEINDSAKFAGPRQREDGTVWLDVAYPAYHGVLNLTFTSVGDSLRRDEVMANRVERMSLNLAGHLAEEITLESPGGFRTLILVSRSPSLIPVQILSVGSRWAVSGAFTFTRLPDSADSVRPVIDAVTDDLIHAAKMMR